MGWRDYRDMMRQMETDMQRFTDEAFGAFFENPGLMNRFWQPAADVHETDAGVIIKLELAGVTTESVSVSLSGNGRQLTVSGTRTEQRYERELRTGCHQLEIYFGPFERAFILPPDLEIEREAIGATLKDGFLTIILPRRVREAQPAQNIPIAIIEP